MAPKEYAPAPQLANLVHCYWITQRHFYPLKDTFQVFPDRFIEIIVSYGAPGFLLTPDTSLPLPALYLVPLLKQPFTLRFEGPVTIVAARLYAWALELLLPAPMTAFALPITSLEANFPQILPQLAACLEQNQPQQAVLCLEAVYFSRSSSAYPSSNAGLSC